jgi:LppP/LprE lipoprotein
MRLLGLLATLTFLGSGAAIAMMVMPDRHHSGAAAKAPQAQVKAVHSSHPALTKAQKRARHNAVAALAADGYQPARLADWRPKAALKVLVGRNEQGAMRAYFFSGGAFIGHDDAATSNDIRVAKQGKDSVTLSYRVSTGGREKVTFELQEDAAVPASPVPPSTIR